MLGNPFMLDIAMLCASEPSPEFMSEPVARDAVPKVPIIGVKVPITVAVFPVTNS